MKISLQDILAYLSCSALVVVLVIGFAIQYPKERCGSLQSHFDEKAAAAERGYDLYPGFELTAELQESCPGIHE